MRFEKRLRCLDIAVLALCLILTLMSVVSRVRNNVKTNVYLLEPQIWTEEGFLYPWRLSYHDNYFASGWKFAASSFDFPRYKMESFLKLEYDTRPTEEFFRDLLEAQDLDAQFYANRGSSKASWLLTKARILAVEKEDVSLFSGPLLLAIWLLISYVIVRILSSQIFHSVLQNRIKEILLGIAILGFVGLVVSAKTGRLHYYQVNLQIKDLDNQNYFSEEVLNGEGLAYLLTERNFGILNVTRSEVEDRKVKIYFQSEITDQDSIFNQFVSFANEIRSNMACFSNRNYPSCEKDNFKVLLGNLTSDSLETRVRQIQFILLRSEEHTSELQSH